MRIERRRQPVMHVLWRAALTAPKVLRLRHAPRGQDADQLVEERIVGPHCLIQRRRQSLQPERCELEQSVCEKKGLSRTARFMKDRGSTLDDETSSSTPQAPAARRSGSN